MTAQTRGAWARRLVLAAVAVAVYARAAPIPRAQADICSLRYEISPDDGAVRDKNTNLVWQRELDLEPKSWNEAVQYCAQLPEVNHARGSLPDALELQTLIDDEKASDAAIDSERFPGTPEDWFWTSTRSARDPTSGFAVNFYNGEVGLLSVSEARFVRCVYR